MLQAANIISTIPQALLTVVLKSRIEMDKHHGNLFIVSMLSYVMLLFISLLVIFTKIIFN